MRPAKDTALPLDVGMPVPVIKSQSKRSGGVQTAACATLVGVMKPPLPRRPLILAACMAAVFMAAVEATIIATVMPSIASSLGGFGLFAWAFSAYMLAQAATIPIYGRLADIYGRRNVFVVGTILFLLGSALCGLAHSMAQLVVFRAIQGSGAGGVQPIANTIIGDIYTPIERARVQGMLSGVFGVAAAIGPALGAVVVHYGDWPLVFWINLPIGAVAIIMIMLLLPPHEEVRAREIDYWGALLLVLTISLLMVLVSQNTGLSTFALRAASLLLVLATVVLVRHERRISGPMLPLELWRNRVIVSSGLGNLVTGTLMMGVTAYLPTYIQGVMGRGADVSAVVLALMSIVWVFGSSAAGLYLPHTSYRRAATAGALTLVAGAAMLITMTPQRGPAWVGVGVVLVGVGMGICNTTFMISAQTSVAWRQRGAATSSTMFLRFLGQSLGAALFGGILNATFRGQTQEEASAFAQVMDPKWRATLSATDQDHLIGAIALGMRHGYLLTGVLALLALLVARTYAANLGPAVQMNSR